MAPELRKRKSKADLKVEEPVVAAVKKSAKSPKTEKRKANEDASPIVTKKQRPTKDALAAVKKTEVASPKPALKKKASEDKLKAAAAKPSKKKKAADIVAEADVASPKPAKKAKVVVEVDEDIEVVNSDPKSARKQQKTMSKKTKVVVEEKEPEVEVAKENEPTAEDEEEVDEETRALVDALDSGNEDEDAQMSTYTEGQDVGKAPKAKKSKTPAAEVSGQPGVVYLGSIPHGFYEHQIRDYFSQFGAITKLRVVRSKKTGASRHRAFLEFADAEVADIAARTMDKYLLFGHILQAKVVPTGQVHPNLFKGCNRRFKAVPWNKMAGKQLERALPESKWQGKITKEEQRRAARAEKLKEIGYEFEAPALKAAEAKVPAVIEGVEEEAAKPIEAAPEVESAEDGKRIVEAEKVEVPEVAEAEEATISQGGKKRKSVKKAKKVKA
ncbi:hypothetical protein B0T19DRAFT_403633 [Cercophora scortea]|uniref:RRM domain-containing protein n=1 Tax=Cercophora scortea TaxID=314031 RepID=A0AAE0I9M3_9PEZI|nr:hypothetical protein B0T19DRAFT_403633 [Cercophora scortea]